MQRVLLWTIWVLPVLATGQSAWQVRALGGLELPIYYTVGAQVEYQERWGLELRAGLLTRPWDRTVISILEWNLIGLEPELADVLENAFRQGYYLSLRPSYRWGARRRHQVALSLQYLHLSAAETGAAALEAATGRDLNRLRPGATPLAMTLQVDLWNLGAYYSYRIPLPPRWDLQLEAGLHRTIGMRNAFTSNRPNLDGTAAIQTLYANLDQDLRDLFADYGYIPSVNVLLAYRLTR